MLGTARFLRYAVVGTTTFVLDLALLFLFTDVFGINYIFASGVAFLIAVSFNYYLSRKFVFPYSERGVVSGYLIFIIITLVGLLLVMAGMYVLVDWLNIHYIVSRVLVALVTSVWNYTMNLFINFRVAGRHARGYTP